uniref:Immunoglobulin domain-containing protein n=1 Tax=Echeneis naucrates TaxID=173247 RepID=A0A665TZ06_ECHNA
NPKKRTMSFFFCLIPFLLLILFECFLFVSTGQNDVICPPQPIQTEEGETVSIRCRLNQTVDLQDEMISVRRQNLNEEVILYRDGKDHSEDNADSIRFSLNHEDLKGGILNLQISSVQLSDRGLYTVYIRGRKILFKVFLNVGMMGILIFLPSLTPAPVGLLLRPTDFTDQKLKVFNLRNLSPKELKLRQFVLPCFSVILRCFIVQAL